MKKNGFTLAEVLITLGVIGVISAMTIPVVIQGYRKQEATSKLKKFYSTMAQAVQLAEEEQGVKSRQWNDFAYSYDSEHYQQGIDDAYTYWNKYLAKYVQTLKVEKGTYDKENDDYFSNLTKIYFPDGTTAFVDTNGRAYCIWYDINGDKKPNEKGRDRFIFLLANPRTLNSHELQENISFNVGWLPNLNTRAKAFNKCKTNAIYCTTLLFYDNFEFKSDYPYKL